MSLILIADDDAQNRLLLETILRKEGHDVVPAVNGAEAIERASQNPPSLVITDLLMPVMDGFELCRRWRADDRLKDVPAEKVRALLGTA